MASRVDVDGVPVFFCECPGPALGTLVFRVGVCDETLTRRGITHLVEHLALAGFDHRTREFNGSVGPSFTSFTIRGTPDEVCRHLTDVARAVVQLPLDRARHESNILRAEAAQREYSGVGRATMLRFGPQSFGLLDYEELFLHEPEPAALSEWAATYFQRANAAVVLSCPPTPDLRLDALGDGSPRIIPPVIPLPGQYPAWERMPARLVAAVAMVERSVVVNIASWILGERLRDRMRVQLALSYNAGASYDAWAPQLAHLMMWADCRPNEGELVADWMQAELSRIIIDGITDDELANFLCMVERNKLEPYYPYGNAGFASYEHLFGNPVLSMEEFEAQQRAVTSADVESSVAAIQQSAMWIVPSNATIRDHRRSLVNPWSTGAVMGREFVAQDLDDPFRVRIGREGVGVTDGADRRVTILWSRLAACKRWADGGRTLFGHDAFTLTIDPRRWRGGHDLIAEIDAMVAAPLVVTCADRLAD